MIQHILLGGRITTSFGDDWDPVEKKYRFHRAIDIAGGDGVVRCPAKTWGVEVENPSTPSYGTLVRLLYGGFELRLAHISEFNPEFLVYAKQLASIPEGMIIGQVGSLGKSTGPHVHVELVVSPNRSAQIGVDAAIEAKGWKPRETWTEEDLMSIKRKGIREWMKDFGVSSIGPHEVVCWDRRTNRQMLWTDPRLFWESKPTSVA